MTFTVVVNVIKIIVDERIKASVFFKKLSSFSNIGLFTPDVFGSKRTYDLKVLLANS